MAYVQRRFLNPSWPQQQPSDIMPVRATTGVSGLLPDIASTASLWVDLATIGFLAIGGLVGGYTVGWLYRELRSENPKRRRPRRARRHNGSELPPSYAKGRRSRRLVYTVKAYHREDPSGRAIEHHYYDRDAAEREAKRVGRLAHIRGRRGPMNRYQRAELAGTRDARADLPMRDLDAAVAILGPDAPSSRLNELRDFYVDGYMDIIRHRQAHGLR